MFLRTPTVTVFDVKSPAAAFPAEAPSEARISVRTKAAFIVTSLFNALSATVANDRIGRPEQRMGVGENGLALVVEISGPVHQRELGFPQGFGTAELGIGGLASEQVGH